MKENLFDEVTKALATATSRREALRRIGGILGGTALAGLFPGLALADNSACAHFCDSVFDPGPDRGRCKSDAAHGTGLCYTCGPAGPNLPICCPKNPDGTCTSYSSATCCSGVQQCVGGTCVTPTTTTTMTPTTTTTMTPTTTTTMTPTTTTTPAPCGQLSNGTSATCCSSETDCSCTSNCEVDVTGQSYCTGAGGSHVCCNSDADCPLGEFCNGDIGFSYCPSTLGVCTTASPC